LLFMMANGVFARCRQAVGWVFVGAGFAVVPLVFSSCARASKKADEIPVAAPLSVNPQVELSTSDVMPGTLVLVKVSSNGIEPKGEFEGMELPFYPAEESGVFESVLPIPYERKPGPGTVKVTLGEGEKLSHLNTIVNVIPDNYRSEKLHVDGRRVTPTSQKDLIRIKKEQAEVGALYRNVIRTKYWKGPFELPVQSAVTSAFGTKRVYNGHFKSYHGGLDLRAAIGTPVLSAAPGVVVLAKNLFFSGNTVLVDHGYGVITLYAHLSRLRVNKGDLVQARQVLGLSGKTGRVNGPHLHWQAVVHKIKANPMGLVQVVH
jgi:hypothetical protein